MIVGRVGHDVFEVGLLPEGRGHKEGDLGLRHSRFNVGVNSSDLREATRLARCGRALDEDATEGLDDLDLLRVFGDGSEMDLVPAEGHASSECLAGVSCTEDGNAHGGSMTYGCLNLDVASAGADLGKGLDKTANTANTAGE